METSVIPVQDNPVPKSTGSLVQISSIYIDLQIPMEKNETESCQHNFSILGYAAEMRMKNPKASMPFASDGNLTDTEEQLLPPLHVPKFRWWRCPECCRKINDTSATEEIIHSNCCTNGLIASSTCLNVPSHGDTAMVLSGTQQVPTAQRSDGIRDVDINAPPRMISVHDSPLSSGHQKTNDAETGDAAVTGGDTEPVDPVIDKAGDIRDEETIAQIGNIIATGDNRGPTGQVKNDDGNREFPRELQQSADGSSGEIPVDGKHNCVDAKQRIKQMSSGAGDGAHKIVEVAIAGPVSSTGVAPLQVEECDNASSESDHNTKHENSSGVSRRKTRKLRLLTDLLGDKGNLRSDNPRDDDSSFHSKLVASSGLGTLVSQDQASCEDVGKGSKSPQRKRKMPQEEPQGIADLAIIGTNDCMSKADSERTVTDTAICGSEGQANASSGVRLQTANKNDRLKYKTERTPALIKRKNKQIQVHDRFSPRPGEQSSSKNNVKDGDLHGATANTLFRSLETSSAAGTTDNHCRNSQSPQEPQRENGDVSQTASQISKFQPSHLKVGLDLSLNSFAEKIDSSVNKEKATTSKSVLEKNGLHFGQCSIMPAPEPDLLRKKSQVWDLNERIAQNSPNLLEKRNFSLLKETSCHKEKTFEVQGCPREINKQSDQMAGNRIVQGSSDDIPMEIVELMAKNQYERGLADAGNHSFRPKINNSMRRFPEVQGMGPMTQLEKGFPGLTSFSPANSRSGLAVGGVNAGAAKGNSINYSQMNRNRFEMGQPEKNKVSIFSIFPQNQQILPCAMQYPASASVRTGSQHSERAETLSSSTAPNMSFGLGIQQKYPAQGTESQHRGKTISDIKADELKRTQEARNILSKPGSSELNAKPKGPLDPYANESIPAMQLLSLMDGKSPGNTYNMDTSKPFAPCGYHPRFSTAERRDFLNGSFFQRQNHAKDLHRLGTGLYSLRESSGRPSFSFSGQPKEQEQSYIPWSTSCVPYTGQASSWGKDKQKATLGASDSITYLQQHRGRGLLILEDESVAEVVRPLRSIPPDEYNCATNRNPAEFTLPDAGNAFTICGKDLKFPKRKYSRENMRDGAKRQRLAKPKAGKGQPQIPSA